VIQSAAAGIGGQSPPEPDEPEPDEPLEPEDREESERGPEDSERDEPEDSEPDDEPEPDPEPSPDDDDEDEEPDPSEPDPSEPDEPDPSAPFEPADALVPGLEPPRSFFAHPEPLKWMVGGANSLRIVPSLPHDGQNCGPGSLRPWRMSVRWSQAVQAYS
jgi:hypothetical protein